MSYLSLPTSKTQHGVVQVGSNINVDDNGNISIAQDVSPNAAVTFANITDSALTQDRIVFVGLNGLLTDDANLTFNANTNTVTTGNISVTDDLYVGGNTNIDGNVVIGGNISINGNNAISSVVPTAGDGISITNLISTGPSVSFDVNNTGVTGIFAGLGISVSANVGNVTISASGADFINTIGVTADYSATSTDEYIGVNSTSLVIITLPIGIDGRVYSIKDEYGPGFGKIIIQGTDGEEIDNASDFTISVPNESVTTVFRAGQWRIF